MRGKRRAAPTAPGLVATLCLMLLGNVVNADPRADYMLKCQGCHLPDGSGYVGKVPSFAQMGYFLEVEGGRDFLVQVPGTSQSSLNDDETAAVLNWILTNFSQASLPRDFRPYTEDEIGRLRAVRMPDVEATRAAIMERIRAHRAASSGP